MPSINVDLNFFSHRKAIRLSGQLGDQAITCLLRLWCYVGQHDPEFGSLGDMLDYEIEHVSNWRGDQGVFVRALISIGLLDIIDGKAFVHGWTEHARHLIVYRNRAKRAAVVKWESHKNNGASSNASSNASSMLQADSLVEKSIAYASSNASSNAKDALSIVPIQYNTIHSNTIKNKKPRKIPWPNDLTLTDELKSIAKERGFDPGVEFERAKDHCLANGKQYANYHAFLRNWFRNEQFPKKKTMAASITQPCQERVYRGLALKPCGAPSVTVFSGRPLCQEHKEYHERKSHHSAT